jgi:hypothetical protein
MDARIKWRISITILSLIIITIVFTYLIGKILLGLPLWYVIVLACIGEIAVLSGVAIALRILRKK